MGYRDKERQRRYQQEWLARRRAEWFADKACERCGSTSNLEIDHINSDRKVDHRIFQWAKARRDRELAKCQVLCNRCHKEKTAEALDGTYKFDATQVENVRTLRSSGLSIRAVSHLTGVSRSQVHRIVTKRTRVPFV